MSRVYFHSPSGTAELRGSERAHLGFVAAGPARAAWGFDRHTDMEQLAEICAMIPEVPDGEYGSNYLHNYLREAQAENARNRSLYEHWTPGRTHPSTSYGAQERFRSSLELKLLSSMSSTAFEVAGHRFEADNVTLNTALVAGSRPIQLAAKIHGWCEVHAWVGGPDREWLAEVIDEGLAAGIYRRGIWYSDRPDGPKDQWSSQGWEEVATHLRSRDDEPCVMSYSVGSGFPNSGVTDWSDAVWPDGVEHRWEVYDTLTSEQKQAIDDRGDAWYELPADEQWTRAMDGLRERRPWAQLTPDNLAETTFRPGVTVYDLLAADRDERVRAHFQPGEPTDA